MTTVKELKRKTIILDRQNNMRYITQSISPCHHGMACPQVLDGGMVSIMEGSCEYIE
jgi:ribosomal protein RSM22 (predicted rRNA methylase)